MNDSSIFAALLTTYILSVKLHHEKYQCFAGLSNSQSRVDNKLLVDTLK